MGNPALARMLLDKRLGFAHAPPDSDVWNLDASTSCQKVHYWLNSWLTFVVLVFSAGSMHTGVFIQASFGEKQASKL